MKKEDLRNLTLSLIINAVIIFLLPKMEMPLKDEGKISIGLVQLKEKKEAIKEPAKTKPKVEKVEEKPKETPKKQPAKEVKKEVTKKQEKKVIPVIKEPELLISEDIKPRKKPKKTVVSEKKSLKQLDKTKKNEQKNLQNDIIIEDIVLDVIEIPEKKYEVEDLSIDYALANVEIDNVAEEASMSKFIDENSEQQVLPKGYKLGSIDGQLTPRWDESNKLPSYPQYAAKLGDEGTVELVIEVEEDGSIKDVKIKKSGVPELDIAIEKVVRTWTIHLSKGGKKVYGTVIVEIPFRLLAPKGE